MKVGIIGSDHRAVAIGRLLVSGGHDVTFGDVRSEASAAAAAPTGTQVESPYHQAMTRDLLIFAFARNDVDRAITALGARPRGVVVDAIDGPSATHGGAELLAHKLDSHEVVRALIVLPQPGATIAIAGDDPDAKALVEAAFEACGCVTADRGPLANAAELEPGGVSIAA
jgi:predicted dinucleotide-binding enzyme